MLVVAGDERVVLLQNNRVTILEQALAVRG